jgi:guanylate kinase
MTGNETKSDQEGAESPLLLVLSGPSGVGKDTVMSMLLDADPRLRRVTTVTTRTVRPGEVEGQDYFFVSKERFEGMVQDGDLLEHALVYGQRYGVPREQVSSILDQGFDALLHTDVQGAATIKQLAPEGLFIFLAPASIKELSLRLQMRHGGPGEDNEHRLIMARKEMESRSMFDHVVTNLEGELEGTVAEIRSILDSERNRRPPRQVTL